MGIMDSGQHEDVGEIAMAISAFLEVGEPQDLKIVSLVKRLLADDFNGSGVYEVLEEALDAAENGQPGQLKAITTKVGWDYADADKPLPAT